MCWGNGSDGQHGMDNSTTNYGLSGAGGATMGSLRFISFSDTVPAVQISGSHTTCALFANRRVRVLLFVIYSFLFYIT
jgi:hypothetical protein